MGISDMIADFIVEALTKADGPAELQRGELADRFGCVPSQINYVLSTRFTPEHGYIVESRRGSGGYIRIQQVRADPRQLVMHTVNAVGDSLDPATASALLRNLEEHGSLSPAAANLIRSALTDAALRSAPPGLRDRLRAGIFTQMLIQTLR